MTNAATVKYDFIRNRLYIKLVGFPSAEELFSAFNKYSPDLAKLKPGWVMVSDVSESKAVSPEAAHVLEQIMEQYKQFGIGRIVRIVGHEVITKLQYSRLSQQAGIPVNSVGTAEEAEELLREMHL